jgi:hypothetical protein
MGTEAIHERAAQTLAAATEREDRARLPKPSARGAARGKKYEMPKEAQPARKTPGKGKAALSSSTGTSTVDPRRAVWSEAFLPLLLVVAVCLAAALW